MKQPITYVGIAYVSFTSSIPSLWQRDDVPTWESKQILKSKTYTEKHKIICTHIFIGKTIKRDARIFLNNTLNISLMDYGYGKNKVHA